MKKLLYVFVACCFATMASAQTVTEKDLQGNWKMASFFTSGITLDIATSAVTISEELKSQITPDIEEQINTGMQAAAAQLKDSSLTINGKNLSQKIAGTEKKGTYVLKDLEGKQYIAITYDDGTSNEVSVTIKDKQLHITRSENGQEAEFIYTRG
jgi:hypothetical protein